MESNHAIKALYCTEFFVFGASMGLRRSSQRRRSTPMPKPFSLCTHPTVLNQEIKNQTN